MSSRNEAPVYGLDAELKAKKDAKFDPALEDQARKWIEAVLKVQLPGDFHEELKSGVILCTLINTIAPGTVGAASQSKMVFKQMENINNYLNGCKKLNMPAHELFMTIDLYEAQNMVSVIDNIHALSRYAAAHGYSGPTIGPKLSVGSSCAADEETIRRNQNALPKLTKVEETQANAQGIRYDARREIVQ